MADYRRQGTHHALAEQPAGSRMLSEGIYAGERWKTTEFSRLMRHGSILQGFRSTVSGLFDEDDVVFFFFQVVLKTSMYSLEADLCQRIRRRGLTLMEPRRAYGRDFGDCR